jgi:hypothetical protein
MKLNTMPDFFMPSKRLKELAGPGPTTNLDYHFSNPDMSGFLDAFEGMIDSGNLFKYEDYDYIQNGNVVNNLEQCVNLYGKTETGWLFKRRERIKTGQNLNFTVYNKTVGWFPEIAANNPELVTVCDNFIEKFDVDVWKILVFKVDQDLVWHMDVDGFYGFRLFIGHDDWTLKFREIKPEYKEQLLHMTWVGQWSEVNTSVPNTTFNDEIVFDSTNLSPAFLIDSMNYVHYFTNSAPQYGILIKGVI